MPKNKGRGGKNYRRGKNDNESKRALILKEEGTDYAHVVKMLGNGRLQCLCLGDGRMRLAHIRGKLKKKVWITSGDIILVAMRDFQDEKCDAIYKFFPEEVKQLKNMKEIPENLQLGNQDEDNNTNVNVEFQDKEDSEDNSSSSSSESESDSDSEEVPKSKPVQVEAKKNFQQIKTTQENVKLKKEDIDDI